MLPAQTRSTRHLSAGQMLAVATLSSTGAARSAQLYGPRSLAAIHKRSLWWGHHRVWASYLDPQYEKHIERRRKILKHKYQEALQRNALWDRELGRPSWTSHLSSRWGSHGGRWITAEQTSPQREHDGAESPHQDSHVYDRKARVAETDSHDNRSRGRTDPGSRMERIARKIEEDPFGAIFGHRMGRMNMLGSWSIRKPFGSWRWTSVVSTDSKQTNDVVDEEADNSRHSQSVQSVNDQGSPDGMPMSKASVSSKPTHSQPDAVQSSAADVYEIDPITMRKVPREASGSPESAVNIPVMRFQDTTSQVTGESKRVHSKGGRAADSEKHAVRENHSDPKASRPSFRKWLESEGFGPISSKPKVEPAQDLVEGSGIPTASASPSAKAPIDLGSDVKNLSVESQLGDVEPAPTEASNLTSTDAARVATIKYQAVEVEKQKRREKLEEDFSKPVEESLLAEEAAAQEHIRQLKQTMPRTQDQDAWRKLDTFYNTRIENEVQVVETAYVDQLQAEESTRLEATASTAPEATLEELASNLRKVDAFNQFSPEQTSFGPEAITQTVPNDGRPIIGEGDLSANATKFFNKSPLFGQSRHDVGRRDVEESERKERDKKLIKEVQAIYEDRYGTLDTKHRQPQIETDLADVLSDTALQEGFATQDKTIDTSSYASQISPGSTQATAQEQPQDWPELTLSTSDETGPNVYKDPEELAMYLEEQEQILHEEVKEGSDLLYELELELGGLQRARETTGSTTASELSSSQASSPSETVVYKVVAFDPLSQEMSTAITNSSGASPPSTEKFLSPPEVLLRLTSPAQFLPYLRPLQEEGFELVAGGGDVMVFKKVREPEPAPALAEKPPHYTAINPIDGTTTGNFASPTGFVNHDAVLPPSFSEAVSTSPIDYSASPKVTREEEVFSGRKMQEREKEPQKENGTVRKTARRVFLVGLWVAGCSYAVGVVSEFFRTGGSSGPGVQGF